MIFCSYCNTSTDVLFMIFHRHIGAACLILDHVTEIEQVYYRSRDRRKARHFRKRINERNLDSDGPMSTVRRDHNPLWRLEHRHNSDTLMGTVTNQSIHIDHEHSHDSLSEVYLSRSQVEKGTAQSKTYFSSPTCPPRAVMAHGLALPYESAVWQSIPVTSGMQYYCRLHNALIGL